MADQDQKSSGEATRVLPWALKLGLVFLAGLWLAVVASSWAEAQAWAGEGLPTAASPNKTDDPGDEYDFSWLDPEKKIYVLQNRKYRKAHRVVLSLLAGPGLSNTYRSTLNIEPRAAYYFNEDFGLEFFYTITSNSPNNAFDALVRTNTNVIPVITEIKSQLGVLVHWVPWYAKINMFSSILYFDWYLEAGAGTISANVDTRTSLTQASNIVAKNYTAGFIGTGHQFHLSQTFLIRLDFMGAIYSAPSFGNSGASTLFSNYNFGIGLGVKL